MAKFDPQQAFKATRSNRPSGRRYGALRVFAALHVFLGWITIVVGIIGIIGLFAGASVSFYGIGIAAGLIVGGVALIAFGNLCSVMMDIESNTRAIYEQGEERRRRDEVRSLEVVP